MRITQYLSSSVDTQQVLSPCLELTLLYFHDHRELAIIQSFFFFFCLLPTGVAFQKSPLPHRKSVPITSLLIALTSPVLHVSARQQTLSQTPYIPLNM